jgi:hypothetical protein
MLSAGTVIEREGRLLIYSRYNGYQHHETGSVKHFLLASMRVDGFGSLRTQGIGRGTWLTPPLKVPAAARTMHVNASVRGGLAVEVPAAQSDDNVDRSSCATSMVFKGNATDATLNWVSGDIAVAAGKHVRLRFTVTDGEMFSFWFE